MAFFREKVVWSWVELVYLMENYQVLSLEQLSKDLLKSQNEIITKANQLKLNGKISAKGPALKKRIICICQNPLCRAAFVSTQYEINRGNAKFCSPECLQYSHQINKPSEEQLKADYTSGLSTNDIASKYKISKGTLYNLFKKYGINSCSISESLKILFETEKGYKAIVDRLHTLEQKYGTTCISSYQKLKKGRKEDLGVSVRSGWEGNVLRVLTRRKIKWEYEPRVFYFEGYKRGARAYTPDIYLPSKKIWIEVKGYLRSSDKTKMKRFKQEYPDEFAKMQVIVHSPGCPADEFYKSLGIPIFAYYKDLEAKYKKVIANWE